MRKHALLATAMLLAACSPSAPITDCEPRGNIEAHCGMPTPEDIAALPDGRHLLLAHFGHMGQGTGGISVFDTQDASLRPLYPVPADAPPVAHTAPWGEADCTEPPGATLGPHGTHLHQLQDGRWRYLVVNHGEREAVELFELLLDGDQPQLAWRGCVQAAPDTLANDVVGLSDGSLVYSRMYRPADKLALPKAALGIDSGELWRWTPGRGLGELPGTGAAFPNGLEISADERFLFANMYLEGQVWQVRLDDSEVVQRFEIANADNSYWGSDGRLWIATHQLGAADLVSCFRNPGDPCPGPFEIVALDTVSGEYEAVFCHAGPPMGAATVAVPQAGRVYMGSFAGERMISVPDFADWDSAATCSPAPSP